MANLEMELYQYRNVLFGTILKQHEKLVARTGYPAKDIITSNIAKKIDGYPVKSCNVPELDTGVLYIRGDRSIEDMQAFSKTFKNEKEASGVAERIWRSVNHINAMNLDEDVEESKTICDVLKRII